MKPSEKPLKRQLLLGALGLAVLALLAWALTPSPQVVETAQVTQGRFERAVQENGKTRLRERYLISAPLSGQLARITLKQGDAVAPQAVVATLWPSSPPLLDERSRAEQQASAAALQAAVLRAQATVAQASTALTQVQADLERSETLVKQGFVSATRHESQRLAVRLQAQELARAQQDEQAARHNLARAQVALQERAPGPASARAYALRAPQGGQVLKVLQASEGLVLAGTPLLEVGDPRQLEVVVEVLTEDAARIQPGAQVQLSNWGGSAVLQGQVRRVEPAAFTKVSALGVEEQRVNTVVDILSPPDLWATLGDGFKVDVRILMQVQDNALQVPISALFPVGPRSALMVVDQGRARQREVQVVARNERHAWLQAGVAMGDTVIIYPDTKLQDGDRVAPR